MPEAVIVDAVRTPLGRRNGVLEVEEYHVGTGLRGLLQHAEVAAGNGQFTTVQTISYSHGIPLF